MPTFNTTETTKARSILFECIVLQFILLQEDMRQRCEDTENMLENWHTCTDTKQRDTDKASRKRIQLVDY